MQPITTELVQRTIRPRPADSYKGNYGRVLLIGGNQNFGGAIIMAATAVTYSGAGLVTVATDPQNFASLHARLPEAMVMDAPPNRPSLLELLAGMDVIVIGPGLGTTAFADQLLTTVLNAVHAPQRLVLDGSALTLLAAKPRPLPATPIVVTPHQME